MTLKVEIAGRAFSVTVQSAGGVTESGHRLRVSLRSADQDGSTDTFDIDARQTGLGPSFVYLASGRRVDANVTAAGGRVLVQLPAKDLIGQVNAPRASGAAGTAGHHSGEQRLLAPMPGRVVRVLVKAGDDVVARQGLVVVEAMKMENELGAVRAGRIREVTVLEGVLVESGRVLVIID